MGRNKEINGPRVLIRLCCKLIKSCLWPRRRVIGGSHKKRNITLFSSAQSTASQQHSIGLSCIFIMYFLSFFHFPNQKFIPASSLSVCLWPPGGGRGGSAQSGRSEEVGTPTLWPRPPIAAGGQQEERTPSSELISCLLFHEDAQLAALARLSPQITSFTSLRRFNSSSNLNFSYWPEIQRPEICVFSVKTKRSDWSVSLDLRLLLCHHIWKSIRVFMF